MNEIYNSSAELSWKVPEFDGGSPILGYVIERHLTSSTRWIRVNKELIETLSYKDTDLIEDNEYEYRVMAENIVDVGPPSEPTKPFEARDPWSKIIIRSSNTESINVKLTQRQ